MAYGVEILIEEGYGQQEAEKYCVQLDLFSLTLTYCELKE